MAMFEVGDLLGSKLVNCGCTCLLTLITNTTFGYILQPCETCSRHVEEYFEHPLDVLDNAYLIEDSFVTYVKDVRQEANL